MESKQSSQVFAQLPKAHVSRVFLFLRSFSDAGHLLRSGGFLSCTRYLDVVIPSSFHPFARGESNLSFKKTVISHVPSSLCSPSIRSQLLLPRGPPQNKAHPFSSLLRFVVFLSLVSLSFLAKLEADSATLPLRSYPSRDSAWFFYRVPLSAYLIYVLSQFPQPFLFSD